MLSCEVSETFKNTYFEENLHMAAPENVFMKIREIKIYLQEVLVLTSISQKQIHDLYFMIGFPWKFLWCGENQTPITKYLELIKRRSKVQEKNTSCERALNFDQWKTFSENYKPMRVWLWRLFTNLPRIPHNFSPSSFKLKRGILPLLTKYVS